MDSSQADEFEVEEFLRRIDASATNNDAESRVHESTPDDHTKVLDWVDMVEYYTQRIVGEIEKSKGGEANEDLAPLQNKYSNRAWSSIRIDCTPDRVEKLNKLLSSLSSHSHNSRLLTQIRDYCEKTKLSSADGGIDVQLCGKFSQPTFDVIKFFTKHLSIRRLSLHFSHRRNSDFQQFPLDRLKVAMASRWNQIEALDLSRLPSILDPDESLNELPTPLTHLSLPSQFNTSLANVALPSTLKHIEFGVAFNQPPTSWPQLPNGLESIKLGDHFNQSIQDFTFPIELKKLIFGERFNQSLKGCTLPNGLQHLELPQWNFSPSELCPLPDSLEFLSFGSNKSLDGFKWPSSLRTLWYRDYSDVPLELSTLPASLCELRLISDHAIAGRVKTSPNLKVMQLDAKSFQSMAGWSFPPALNRLVFGPHFHPSIVPLTPDAWPATLVEVLWPHRPIRWVRPSELPLPRPTSPIEYAVDKESIHSPTPASSFFDHDPSDGLIPVFDKSKPMRYHFGRGREEVLRMIEVRQQAERNETKAAKFNFDRFQQVTRSVRIELPWAKLKVRNVAKSPKKKEPKSQARRDAK